MKVTTYETTKDRLVNAPLPEETSSYKPVTHEELIALTTESVLGAGFNIQKESYSMAREGAVANGLYTISNIADKEMQIQIAWQNSYNKQVTLKFAIGVRVFICQNGCVSGDMGSFRRKHTGDVQTFTPKHISEYVKTAGDVFIEMQKAREFMKNIPVNRRVTAELLGRAYLEEQFLNSVQLNIIKGQLENPSFNYGAPGSLWELYNFVTYSLKNDHPSTWMQDHIDAHRFFTSSYSELASGIVIPDAELVEEEAYIAAAEKKFLQLSWLDQIH